MEVRKELKDQVTAITEGQGAEAAGALRSLYALYFAAKATANTAEKAFLLGEGFEFSLKNGVPHLEDKAIFADEAYKHYYPEQ
ncbi:MAG: hypothetical protein UX30_C0003G0087 [Candidatus Saccharibacteria bacterium GW2011_GWA2_46_10]|nr:MAG: hypothetical protein UX30_C0003G0087 [Candidatus Saccharibacteria bacterium GW2011_GWA2_46_10]